MGLPILTEELRITAGADFFVMGEYAALSLGPGAVNLMGARAGAARIAKELRPLFGSGALGSGSAKPKLHAKVSR
jgi:hypothetical protein